MLEKAVEPSESTKDFLDSDAASSLSKRFKSTLLELSEHGFDRQSLDKLYSSGLSKNGVIAKINSEAGKTVVNKVSITKIFDVFEITERSVEEMHSLRISQINTTFDTKRETEAIYGRGFTRDEILNFYKSGKSLSAISRETGISVVSASKIVKEAGIEVRKTTTFREILSDLETVGVTQSVIEQKYLKEGLTQVELNSWMSSFVDYQITDKSCRQIADLIRSKK